MNHVKNNILVSNYPSGRWVVTGQTGDILTSECGLEKSLSFCRKNDTSPQALALAVASQFTWPKAMFEAPTEHKTDAGDLLFTDRGNRVTFDRVRVSDDEIRLTLVHAQQKFGLPLTLHGDDPVFTERMARLADDMGMTILNPEMQPVIAAHRAALACQAPSVAPPMPRKKPSLWPASWPRFHWCGCWFDRP